MVWEVLKGVLEFFEGGEGVKYGVDGTVGIEIEDCGGRSLRQCGRRLLRSGRRGCWRIPCRWSWGESLLVRGFC